MKSKEFLKKKLTNLASGEVAAVLVFWMNFILLKKWIFTTEGFISISFSLFLLTFILIQGSVFWWILIKRISNPGFAGKYMGKILKKLDFILLAVGIFVILLNHGEFSILFISLGIWMFALIEWVNYYLLQLSYSLNPAILWRYLRHRKLKKSKIAKEIEKIL
ncbi:MULTISPECIES: hypothetical protein [Streptococcus]|uniref:hypothetical protein n=1 Tax=Streptococcus TaxID=1301 RepID=UPI0022852AF8|nr:MULTISPECIES: hypothetical protein [Streptococcus]MCY7024068.1 hypothetical protein [Streptococcus sanguinis]MDQ8692061.1 hypothetical protein [Streptococcus sp. IsoGale022]